MFQSHNVGVAVVRFQVPELHPGHRHLISTLTERHAHKLIVVGDHGGMRTDKNPLTFIERKMMIEESFPPGMNIRIEKLRDHPFSNERWCHWLDDLVEKAYPGQKAVMFGSRDSFLSVYEQFGRHAVRMIEPITDISGTATRAAIVQSKSMKAREAIIYNELHRPAIAYSAEDIAIVDDVRERVLGITKLWFDGLWSLPGGFLDPEKDEHDEGGAKREKSEEVLGVSTTDVFMQLGPRIRVADPRYRDSKDKIYASLFVTQYRGGDPGAGDDAKGIRWFERDELEHMFVPWHQPHVERLKQRWDILRGRKSAA